ncbi:MAG: type 4 fimbrial biosis protein PilM, type pilus assembly protein PilM [Candidatus Parcubacteria bacterium]|jgi:type IV pilus assembly protein PilM
MLSALMRIVPPPAYMTMPCIGLDISDTSLKYVAFKPTLRDHHARELTLWGDIDIPAEVINRGEVLDQKKFVAVLREFKEQAKAEYVRVSLPEERAYMFETEIKTHTPLKEVRNLLEFRLEENVPIPSRDVFFDYSIMPMQPGDRTVNVSVVAYAKQTILSYYDACREAGLRPLSFEVEAQAMARAVVPANVSGAALIVDFGKTRTGIGIVHKGTLLYTSTIDIGGLQLSQVLRKTLGEDKSEEELTKIKNTEGLIRGVDSSDVREALMPTVSVIRDEISARMQYWHLRSANLDERRITSIILCGGSSNLKGFPEYMTETLGVPAVRGNVWENAFSLEDTVPPIDRRQSFGYAGAIGLALKNIL